MVDCLPNEIEIEIEKQDRVRRDMWSAKVSSLSRVTPKSRTLDEKVKSGKVEEISLWSNLRSCCRVPNQISRVLEGLRFNLFVFIQKWRSSETRLIRSTK